MFLQRLISDETIGFNYDYMGAAEFEDGGTRRARLELANAWFNKDLKAVKTVLKTQHGDAVPMVVFASSKDLNKIGPETVVMLQKATLRENDPNVRGWMSIDSHITAVFVRENDREAMKALEKFLQPIINEMNAITQMIDGLSGRIEGVKLKD